MHLPQKKTKYRTAETTHTWHTKSWITLGVLPQLLTEEWVLLAPQMLAELSHTVGAQKLKCHKNIQKSKLQGQNTKIQDPESKIKKTKCL